MLYMIHYISNINKSNIACQLPLFMLNLKTQKGTNFFEKHASFKL